MLDKDKLWIVAYVNVSGISTEHIKECITEFAETLKYDESVNTIIIPTQTGESHVEFYNMENIPPIEFDNFKKLIDNLK